ncbi:MAG: PEP-CTERM sorting domain-containing protein, partial [Planctomycetia bacterium]|nr:PEP-CTERM sorting domain-containing protein [Planctomycetia bacterium]
KAAYYKGGGTTAGYYDYATQSDTTPTTVTADGTGNGSAGSTGNSANYNRAADWNSQDGNVTTVGTNGRPNAYGAFDMNGNVTEWNDLTGAADPLRGQRGGSWVNDAFYLSSSHRLPSSPTDEIPIVGFRLASPLSGPSGVPEINPAGLGSVLALVTGALGLLERRRSRR